MKTVTKSEKTGRRALLAGSGAILAGLGLLASAGVPGVADDSPDAELIADCAAYCDLSRHMGDIHPGGATPIEDDDARDLAMETVYARINELSERICEARAVTQAGHKARALCFIALMGAQFYEHGLIKQGIGYDVIAALLRDLSGVAS